jgi:uncharacterized membrane protein YcaP (DUF421 family)
MLADYSFNLSDILFGGHEPLFWLEVAGRTLFLYLYTVFLLRLAPRRNIGRMTPLEMLAIIAVGSAMAEPMFSVDVPILSAMIVITGVIALQAMIAQLTRRSQDVEHLIEGDPIRLVVDGVLDLDGVARATMTREDIFMELRLANYDHLGQVESAYIETNGRVSVQAFARHEEHAGLKMVPPVHQAEWNTFQASDGVPSSRVYGCVHDGYTQSHRQGATFGKCPRCGADTWTDAVTVPGPTYVATEAPGSTLSMPGD